MAIASHPVTYTVTLQSPILHMQLPMQFCNAVEISTLSGHRPFYHTHINCSTRWHCHLIQLIYSIIKQLNYTVVTCLFISSFIKCIIIQFFVRFSPCIHTVFIIQFKHIFNCLIINSLVCSLKCLAGNDIKRTKFKVNID